MDENETSKNLTQAARDLEAAAHSLLAMAKQLDKEKAEMDDLKLRVQRNEDFRRTLASVLQEYTT